MRRRRLGTINAVFKNNVLNIIGFMLFPSPSSGSRNAFGAVFNSAVFDYLIRPTREKFGR
jgi:hypothetical protein